MRVKDIQGGEWAVSVCTSTLLRVKEDVGLDLFKILEDQAVLVSLFGDMVKQTDVLFSVCQNQVKDRGISKEEFADLWNGDTLQGALHAILDSLASYFPKSQGSALRKGVAATQKMVDRIFQRSAELAQQMDVEKIADSLVEGASQQIQAKKRGKGLRSGPGESSGNVPVSSE